MARIERVRFPVVLFDFDGTVIDSGAIILASMRHATREVLGIEYRDEELLQAVGGPGLEAQMAVLAPDRSTTDEMMAVMDKMLLDGGQLKQRDNVVFVAGQPIGRPGTTNLVKLHRVGELW